MKWSDRLKERSSERFDSRFVWWVKQAEAERKIREAMSGRNVYVLCEGRDVLGVFNSPKFPQSQLDSYYGERVPVKRVEYIEDSGVEWQLFWSCCKGTVPVHLVMMEFYFDEI